MIMARAFYSFYFGIFTLLLMLELARFVFSSSPFQVRLANLPRGILIAVLWPLAILSPVGRKHLADLWRFVFSKNESAIIDIKNKSNKKKGEP